MTHRRRCLYLSNESFPSLFAPSYSFVLSFLSLHSVLIWFSFQTSFSSQPILSILSTLFPPSTSYYPYMVLIFKLRFPLNQSCLSYRLQPSSLVPLFVCLCMSLYCLYYISTVLTVEFIFISVHIYPMCFSCMITLYISIVCI